MSKPPKIYNNLDECTHKQFASSETESRGQKRIRSAAHVELDAALLKWFTQRRNDGIPLDGTFLKGKAAGLAQLLGIEDFKCSNGWLDRFKKRHNINWGKVCGEAKDINTHTCDDWLLNEWPKIREGYVDCDVFNGDEMDLFYIAS